MVSNNKDTPHGKATAPQHNQGNASSRRNQSLHTLQYKELQNQQRELQANIQQNRQLQQVFRQFQQKHQDQLLQAEFQRQIQQLQNMERVQQVLAQLLQRRIDEEL
jgi:hypothetical protein